MPAIGTNIGAYRLEEVLGRGGMGVVYRATDTRLGRQVALKLLPLEYGDDPEFRARFLRESRIAASIDHPGVVPIYEAGEGDGQQLYIAMRFVEGSDLAALLRSEGALRPERALALAGQLAAALDAANQRGLVHRDVKPSNAMVARAGDVEHVYLCDFGLSKEAAGDATLSASGAFVGTVRYTAPEVIRTGNADSRSDLYSLGCVLFECLTGEAPFTGPTEAAVVYGHLEEPPPRASERRTGLPRALDAVFARALHKDPERRWASGAELMEAARAALTGTGRSAAVRSAGSRRVVLAALALLALAVAAVAALTVGDSGDRANLAASVKPNGVAVIQPGSASLAGEVALDGAPAAVAEGAGAVWVTDEDRGFVSRVDKETLTVRQTISVGHRPSALAVDRNGVWVANADDGTVSLISPQTNEVVDKIRVARNVGGVCIGSGAVWVAAPLDYAVVRLDPASGRKTGRVRLDAQPGDLACGSGVVWASSPIAGAVTEISTKAVGAVQTVPVGRGASTLALGANALWVVNPTDGNVARIDPRRGVVTATIPVGTADEPADLAVTNDAVWVSSELGGTVTRIDPQRAQVQEKLRVGGRPQGLAVIDGALWVGVADAGARHRGGTLQLPAEGDLDWIDHDPSTSYKPDAFEALTAMHDGLTGYRRQGGAIGTSIVADLADALPTPADGGRTYRFRLRRGITYSNGEPLRASHFRFAIERALRHHPVAAELLGAIRGARACSPRRCDLSRGIVADDAAGTVVFRLTKPDAGLLYKLAMPMAAALPPSVGIDAPIEHPLPVTGPYRIAALEPNRLLRLERNPRFKSWSAAARPDGFPDAIVERPAGGDEKAIENVLAGSLDRVSVTTMEPAQLKALRRRVPGQLRTSISPNTFYFVLNVRRAPFDRVDARRAVAFALDRSAAVAAVGGQDVAQETCQILPPNFPGSRPYCPFTVRGTGGARGRPDVAAARRLVRRSHTRGMRVTVRAPDILPTQLPRLMARTLRAIGYDASFRVLSAARHFAALGDTRSGTQVGLTVWIADFPAPSTFLGNFSCDAITLNSPENLNPSQFCDRRAERLMAEAARLEPLDRATADALWARAERRIVDLAPAVPLYNAVETELVSARLGNYQRNPITGMLIDQAWVR